MEPDKGVAYLVGTITGSWDTPRFPGMVDLTVIITKRLLYELKNTNKRLLMQQELHSGLFFFFVWRKSTNL